MTLSPQRSGRLTASVFANAIGIGYDSRQKLWRQLTGREERFHGNAATQWGSDNEVNAIRQYEIMTGNLVENALKGQEFVIHPSHDWLGCTPDGIVVDGFDRIVIEAKCPASMNLYGEVPAHYMPQVQGQIEIASADRAHFACWTPEGFEVYEVPWSEAYWSECFALLSEFWDCIKNDEEPKKRKKPTLPTVEYRKII